MIGTYWFTLPYKRRTYWSKRSELTFAILITWIITVIFKSSETQVPYHIIIGFDKCMLLWLDMSHCTWIVIHNASYGEKSEPVKVDQGAPQGNVSDPLLCILHTNDLLDIITSVTCIFADDCSIYRVIWTIEDHLHTRGFKCLARILETFFLCEMGARNGNGFQCHKVYHLENV